MKNLLYRDFDICQNIFDCKNIQIKNLNKLIHKHDIIKPNTRFMLTVHEIMEEDEDKVTKICMGKYIER